MLLSPLSHDVEDVTNVMTGINFLNIGNDSAHETMTEMFDKTLLQTIP
jgi:hypothetical protein